MRKRIWGMGLLIMAAFGFMLGGVSAYMGAPGPATGIVAAPATLNNYTSYYADLSEDEIDGLLWMVEEEKLARDVYLTLYQEWGIQVFSNIANSEQMHMDSVLGLIEKYNLTAPDTLDQVGVFTNPEVQALYDQLIEMGTQSEEDALKVGALIEEVDIKDLEEWIAKTDNEDIKVVYTNLMTGSENHLRAFAGQLEAMGIDYTAQVLPQEQVEEILSSPMTMGHGMHGMAYGMANGGMNGQTTQDGLWNSIGNAFRYAWGWMNRMAQRIGIPI